VGGGGVGGSGGGGVGWEGRGAEGGGGGGWGGGYPSPHISAIHRGVLREDGAGSGGGRVAGTDGGTASTPSSTGRGWGGVGKGGYGEVVKTTSLHRRGRGADRGSEDCIRTAQRVDVGTSFSV